MNLSAGINGTSTTPRKSAGKYFYALTAKSGTKKLANPAYIESNAMLDFTISDEDMEVLKNIKHNKDYGEHSGFPVLGGKM